MDVLDRPHNMIFNTCNNNMFLDHSTLPDASTSQRIFALLREFFSGSPVLNLVSYNVGTPQEIYKRN